MPNTRLLLCLATQNPGKVPELLAILRERSGPLVDRLSIQSLADLGVHDDVEETGSDFAENAIIKARAAYARTGLWSLADDSGLEVEALNGAPGVISARYAGQPNSSQRNIEKLLKALHGVPPERRQARFVATLCLYGARSPGLPPDISLRTGIVRGTLLDAPRGSSGFGYDPLFVPLPEELEAAGLPDALRGLTFAELSADHKNLMSHRARAVVAMLEVLTQLCTGRRGGASRPPYSL